MQRYISFHYRQNEEHLPLYYHFVDEFLYMEYRSMFVDLSDNENAWHLYSAGGRTLFYKYPINLYFKIFIIYSTFPPV